MENVEIVVTVEGIWQALKWSGGILITYPVLLAILNWKTKFVARYMPLAVNVLAAISLWYMIFLEGINSIEAFKGIFDADKIFVTGACAAAVAVVNSMMDFSKK